MRKLFDLPCPTATNLTLVIFDLWPANFESMSRRVSFARKMQNHELTFVRDAFLFDMNLMRVKSGWHFESFLIFQSMFRNERASDFNIDRVAARLLPLSRARTKFLFHLLSVTDEATLAPFRLFESDRVLISFWALLGKLSKSSANFLLLICSSGHRFRFFEYTALKCPLCSHSSWLTSHLFTCPLVENLLAKNGVSWKDFELSMREGKWREVLFLLHEVVTVWKNSFPTCIFEDAVLTTFLCDANNLWPKNMFMFWSCLSVHCDDVLLKVTLTWFPMSTTPPLTACRPLTGRPSPNLSPIFSLLAGNKAKHLEREDLEWACTFIWQDTTWCQRLKLTEITVALEDAIFCWLQ
jgi:hypothetical protein